MRRRLAKFLNLTNQLYKNQLGLRHEHSTTHAPLETTEKLRQACDTGKFLCIVFLNFQEAFDTVNYNLKKIKTNWNIIVSKQVNGLIHF